MVGNVSRVYAIFRSYDAFLHIPDLEVSDVLPVLMTRKFAPFEAAMAPPIAESDMVISGAI